MVDYWSTVSGRWLKTSLKGSFSFEMVLYNGRAVMRTKDSMSGDTWLPMGGVKFARPLLREPEREVLAAKAALCYVVPGVLPTASLRKSIDDLTAADDPACYNHISERNHWCGVQVVV